MTKRHCVIVGAGIAGAAAAWWLTSRCGENWRVTVYESNATAGGQLRSAVLNGIRYEPHGPHIFHTSNRLAAAVAQPFLSSYEHRVAVRVECGRHEPHYLAWPLQLAGLMQLPEWPSLRDELSSRPPQPGGGTFEDYAVSLMGPTLYEWVCYGYTSKQWGMEPSSLSASFAPKRLDLRTDGDPRMFRDPWQGWCENGWQSLTDALLAASEIRLSSRVSLETLPAADAYVITAPLDDFLGEPALPWRGHRIEAEYQAGVASPSQPAPTVNWPALSVTHLRRTEPMQMSLTPPSWDGTVICTEYPGSVDRHYPVDDTAGSNRARHGELVRLLHAAVPTAQLAGRLATYTYIDMDQAIIQGVHAAQRVIKEVS